MWYFYLDDPVLSVFGFYLTIAMVIAFALAFMLALSQAGLNDGPDEEVSLKGERLTLILLFVGLVLTFTMLFGVDSGPHQFIWMGLCAVITSAMIGRAYFRLLKAAMQNPTYAKRAFYIGAPFIVVVSAFLVLWF